MNKHITSYTGPNGQPSVAYVSINFDDAGEIVITVRAQSGQHSAVTVPAVELIRMCGAIVKNPEVLSKAVCQALVADARKKP